MESTVKVTCTPSRIGAVFQSGCLNITYYNFDVQENGFDPRMISPEDWEEMLNSEPWVYNVHIRHADYGNLKPEYASLEELILDMKKREGKYLMRLGAVKEERRKRA